MWTKSEKRIVALILYIIYLTVSIFLWMELVSIVVKSVPEHLIWLVASTIGIALFIIGTVIFVIQVRAIEKRAREIKQAKKATIRTIAEILTGLMYWLTVICITMYCISYITTPGLSASPVIFFILPVTLLGSGWFITGVLFWKSRELKDEDSDNSDSHLLTG